MVRALIRLTSLSAVGLSAVWFAVSPDYEPAVTFLAGLAGALGSVFVRGPSQNHPDLSVHTENAENGTRDSHETFPNAMSIVISNAGNTPIHISRARFDNHLPTLWGFRRSSNLPVHPRAFKDNGSSTYPLTFKNGRCDPQVDVPPRVKIETYLPLSERVPDENYNRRRHGEIILRYSSDGVAGIHRVVV
jgi:hypothetical protein